MQAIIAQDASSNSGDYVTRKGVLRTGIDDVPPIVFIIDGCDCFAV